MVGAPSGEAPVEPDPSIDDVLVEPALDAVPAVPVPDVEVMDDRVELPLVVDELADEKLTAPVMSNWLSGGGGTVPLFASIAAVPVVDDPVIVDMVPVVDDPVIVDVVPAAVPLAVLEPLELLAVLPVLVPAAPAVVDEGRQLLLPIVLLVLPVAAA